MLGHQQLLQQQHQQHHNQHQHQNPHPHPHPLSHSHSHPLQQQAKYQQHQESHQEFQPASGKKLVHPSSPLSSSSTSSTASVSAINIKSSSASASLAPAYPFSNHSNGPVSTNSLPSVSSSSATLASVAAGDASTGTGENFVPNIKKAKYSTSLDPRGFIPVFEYDLYGHPIMWDQENLYVHFTGIWKALGKTKADIVKIIDANPILETIIRKVRGGFLKIQGTWMPHQEAYDLAKKTCYKLRHELVPVFGAAFVNDCIPPAMPGFGSIHLTVVRRRASECVVGQRQAVMGAQQLRLQQTHIHPSLKRRYSSNDVGRLSRFNQTGGPPTSSQLSTSFLLNRSKDYQRDESVDDDQDGDLDLDPDEEDAGANHASRVIEQNSKHRFHRTGRFNSMGDNDDDDDDDDDRLLDDSTADEEDHRSLSGSYDDDDIDIDGESCSSEQDDPMYGLARLDLSRRNSSPMPLNTAYALSAGMGAKSATVRARRGRPPTRSPMPVANRIAANYVAYNNYVSSNTQAAQGLGRNSGQSSRTQKQQLRQQQKLQNQLQQQKHQQHMFQQHQHQQQQRQQYQHQSMQQQQQQLHQMHPSQVSTPDQELSSYQGASSSPGLSHQELVEFFKAGQALQRMSQDDGSRPWKQDGGRMILPKKIVLGEQVFQCVGGEYKCVPEPNNMVSSKAPGEDDGWSR
ncbi:hypothetical protein BGX23_007549 [Mortierella sp. AD031]|nr:hypothetical protein BGX23_007549 [Mortierella sp. AD031]KAG0219114.1 hypothetical protein BGX33_004684 [Mortierella sp. NVP41]